MILLHSGEYMGRAMRIHSNPTRNNITRALARLPEMPRLISLELPLPGAGAVCKLCCGRVAHSLLVCSCAIAQTIADASCAMQGYGVPRR